MRNASPLVSLLGLCFLVAGCPAPTDPPGTDTGTERTDTGGPTDAGVDAPLPPVDAGPEVDVAGGDVTGEWCGALHVTGDVTVPAGQTLTVCAGAVVRFDADVALTVAGTLLVEGSAAARVRMFGDAAWAGIAVDGTLTATFLDITGADRGIGGAATSAISVEDSSIVLDVRAGTTIRLANGGRFDRTRLIGGGTIYVTGGVLQMTDSVIDQLHGPGTPDCTDWAGGGLVLDHVWITGCHCPIHINSADAEVTITNSILDGATNPIMIANSTATITHNNFSGTGTLVLDIGRRDEPNIEADVSDNYWDGGEPNIGTTTRSQFTGDADYSMTPFEDVGPR